MQELDLLILGAGWTSTFLIPLLNHRNLHFSATTRDGRDVAGSKTIKWSFDPSDISNFSSLPIARHVLITFPLVGTGQSRTLVEGYWKIHNGKKSGDAKFIQLGSTGIWQIPQKSIWTDRKSPYDAENKRAVAEDELRSLGGCVLNLAGLWGGTRDAKTWVPRVAKTKEEVSQKKSVHLIHGLDVARGILGVVQGDWKSHAKGQRWMLTDGFVYDWWSLFAGWADGHEHDGSEDREPIDQAKWVLELMEEEGIKALPRSMEVLGRCYDSREFWRTFGIAPLKARI